MAKVNMKSVGISPMEVYDKLKNIGLNQSVRLNKRLVTIGTLRYLNNLKKIKIVARANSKLANLIKEKENPNILANKKSTNIKKCILGAKNDG